MSQQGHRQGCGEEDKQEHERTASYKISEGRYQQQTGRMSVRLVISGYSQTPKAHDERTLLEQESEYWPPRCNLHEKSLPAELCRHLDLHAPENHVNKSHSGLADSSTSL
jgi:hypothetical protein